MAGRWRTWDLDCLEETLGSRSREKEVEPLILAGSLKEIPYIHLSSIFLPEEAQTLAWDDASLRSRGRGRSLADRALASDKPSRRPGERGASDKSRSCVGRARSVGSPKPTLRSKFLGSEELYEDLFLSLGQPTGKTETKTSIVPKWGNIKPKKERPSSHELRNFAEKTTNIEGSFFEEPKEKFKSDETGDLYKSSDEKISTNIADISNNVYKAETSRSSSEYSKHSKSVQEYFPNNDNTKIQDTQFSLNIKRSGHQEFKATETVSDGKIIALCDSSQFDGNEINIDDQSLDTFKVADVANSYKNGSKNDSHLFSHGSTGNVNDQLNSDKLEPSNNLDHDCARECENENKSFQESSDDTSICHKLCESPEEKTVCCEEKKQVKISQLDINTGSSADVRFNHSHSTDDGLSQVRKDETLNLLATKYEVEKHVKQNDLNDNSDASLDTSTNELEMDPCNILLENLPLAITQEELQEIVEPYGEMISYKFQDEVTGKICNIRMPCSLSGELLVVSVDGLELNGYRIKATMTTEA